MTTKTRFEVLEGVLDEGSLEEVASSIPPEAMESGRALLRFLAHNSDEWDRVGQWRMGARTEAYKRAYALRGEGKLR